MRYVAARCGRRELGTTLLVCALVMVFLVVVGVVVVAMLSGQATDEFRTVGFAPSGALG